MGGPSSGIEWNGMGWDGTARDGNGWMGGSSPVTCSVSVSEFGEGWSEMDRIGGGSGRRGVGVVRKAWMDGLKPNEKKKNRKKKESKGKKKKKEKARTILNSPV
jgi:hypothetical protein